MKLCDITQFYSPVSGGVKRYVSEKQKYITAHGHEHVLIIPGEEHECRREGHCTIYTVRSPRVDRTSRYRVLLDMPRAREIIRAEHPDIIESGDPYHLAWAAIEEAARLHIPAVAFYHSHFPDAYLRTVNKYCGPILHDFVQEYAKDYIYRLYRRFSRTLVPSPHLAELLRSWGVDNATPVRLGVDTSIFCLGTRQERWREEFGAGRDQVLLLSVGRLAYEKNTLTLLGAFEELCRREPGRYRLLVVGDGPLRFQVQETQQRTGALAWRKYFHDSSELAEVYRAADLFVHPGVCETFGLVTVEAQACGVPVVGIHGSYMDRLAFAGLDLWAEANSPSALADAIARFAACDLPAFGRQASVRAVAEYGWDGVFAELFDIFAETVRECRR